MLPRAPFGSTGHLSTRIIFGAAALGSMSPERAAATLEVVRAAGIDHIDTAASYGRSEDLLAPFLAQHRDEVFLATKTGERDGRAARDQLKRSLERMGVDQIDLIQLHNLVEPDEWATAHAVGGAVEAMAKARDEGLVRFIGVTGHGLRIAAMHLRSLERFPFDSVLFPYNHALLEHGAYRDDVEQLLEVCRDRQVAVQTIKSVARRRWDDDGGPRRSWYQPLPPGPALARAVRFVLAREQLFLNTSSDATLLPEIIDAARGDLTAPSTAELEADMHELGIRPLFDGRELERI